MKKLFLLLGVAMTAIVPTAAQDKQQSETLVLTLEQALQIALTESPTIQIADQTIQTKQYAKRGTYAQLYPEIAATGTFQRTIEKQTMHFMNQSMKVGTANTYSGGFTAAMPLVNAQLWTNLKISALDVELAVEQARSSRIDMVESVSQAYYQILLAKEAYDVYKRVYDNAVENYNNVKRKFDVGLASEYDMIRSHVSVSNAEPNVYNAENSITIALWQLKAIIGMNLDRNIDIAGSINDYESALAEEYRLSQLNLDRNSTMKQLDIQEQQLQKSIKLYKMANVPTLSLSAAYMYTSMNDNFKFNNYIWNPYSYATLSLNIPIFAGNKKRSDVRKARLDLSNLQLQRENTERNLQVSIVNQLNTMQTNAKQFNAASSSADQARRGYEIAVKRYEVGSGTLLEIDDSQLAYTTAQLTRCQAIYDFLNAKTALDKILGNNTEN